MTDLEYDLNLAAEFGGGFMSESDDDGFNIEATAKNLSKMGYQKIVWHDAKKELPEVNKNISAYSEYVLGYEVKEGTFAVVTWDGSDWTDTNLICYNVDYWAELPKFKDYMS